MILQILILDLKNLYVNFSSILVVFTKLKCNLIFLLLLTLQSKGKSCKLLILSFTGNIRFEFPTLLKQIFFKFGVMIYKIWFRALVKENDFLVWHLDVNCSLVTFMILLRITYRAIQILIKNNWSNISVFWDLS